MFKATNKTAQAFLTLGKPIKTLAQYTALIDNLYFLFRESIGQRLEGRLPQSFSDVNLLRTELRHDVDHGDKPKIRKKRKKIGETFAKFAAAASPEVIDPTRFLLVQANILSAIDLDLQNLAL